MGNRRMLLAAVGLLVGLSAGGCAISRRYAYETARLLPQKKVKIKYQVQQPAEPAAETRSWRQAVLAAFLSAGSPTRTLSIRYPHPNPAYGDRFALVTLRITSPAFRSVGSALRHAIPEVPWALDESSTTLRMPMPRHQLQRLLDDLITDGFFDSGFAGNAAVLRVEIGSRSVEKTWSRVSALDELMDRLEHGGRAKRPGSRHQDAGTDQEPAPAGAPETAGKPTEPDRTPPPGAPAEQIEPAAAETGPELIPF